ncbi:MAG: OmpH family outer membrane protein [Caulobacteraceae bacterium]
MTSKPLVAGLCAAAATLIAGSSAFAQAPAAAAPAVTHGPAIAGLCIFSFDNAIGASTVGKYVGTRLQQIGAQVNAELTGENTALENDAKSLDARRATLDQSTFEKQAADIQVRNSALQRKAQLRERELQATEQKALVRIQQEMAPLISQAYQGARCSTLLNRNAVLLANPASDITPAVLTALNAKITQFAFDREHLDGPQAAAAPGGAPPIVQTPAPARAPAPKK